MRILSRSDVERALTMPLAIAAMRDAFAQLAGGEAVVPARTAVPVAPYDAVALFMPAYLGRTPALGGKVVSVHPRNRAAGLPTIHALVVLFDDATGRPLAALEGSHLTALRTGAGAGLATDCLARPDARVLVVFGAGAQAAAQVDAVCAVRPIDRVWVRSRSEDSARGLAARLRGRPGVPADVRPAVDLARALAEADVVCTATAARTPVLEGRWLRAGTHVNAIGAFTTDTREVDDETVRRARVVVDSRAACVDEAGDLVIPWQRGIIGGPETWTELGAIVRGDAPGRTPADAITVFKSVGNAAQDVAAAHVAVREAERLGLGVVVDL
jgi:ornithine cyclodeaminase/alanine dehydrogenase-like protein (mu-crystallin family)